MTHLKLAAPPPPDRPPPLPQPVVIYRCRACRRILGEFAAPTLGRIKCAACNAWNVVQAA